MCTGAREKDGRTESSDVTKSKERHTDVPTLRPSDEDILIFENQIREEEVNVHPLVSTRLPISMLEEEYTPRMDQTDGRGEDGFGIGDGNGSDAHHGCPPHPAGDMASNFLLKIRELDKEYSSLRRLRGDGNCFYRAVSYGLVETIACLEAERREKVSLALDRRLTDLLQGAGFDRMAYEDFYVELLEALADRLISSDNDHLAELWAQEPHRSHSLVVLLRLATSAYLRAHASEYEPFIWEAGLDMISYCQRHVECLGVESDQIHAIALGKALGVDLEIAYLDGSVGPLSRLSFLAEDGHKAPIKLSLLYRPGHYDLLYHK